MVVRPSGTEPKLKAYLEVVVPVVDDDVTAARRTADEALAAIKADLARSSPWADQGLSRPSKTSVSTGVPAGRCGRATT